LEKYKQDITIQTMLYEYFQEQTVKELLTIFGDCFFDNYLKRCCEQILTILNNVVLQDEGIDKNLEKQWPHHYKQKIEMRQMQAIEDAIEKEDLNLIQEIVRKSTKYEYRDNFPNQVLVADEYLVQSLKALKDYFDEGFKNFILT
jgi:hypothetical protein